MDLGVIMSLFLPPRLPVWLRASGRRSRVVPDGEMPSVRRRIQPDVSEIQKRPPCRAHAPLASSVEAGRRVHLSGAWE